MLQTPETRHERRESDAVRQGFANETLERMLLAAMVVDGVCVRLMRRCVAQNDVDEARREELFVKGGDDAGKGVLSLAEVSDAFRATKGLADLSKCKPALIRAFNAAKGFEPSREGRWTSTL
eukprot:317501-Rhodomonas_salina.1